MMHTRLSLILFFLGTLTTQALAGDCEWVTIVANGDTTVLESEPLTSQDASAESLLVHSFHSNWLHDIDGRQRVLLHFPTDGMELRYVVEAELKLYQLEELTYPGWLTVEPIVDPWVFENVRWTNQPSVDPLRSFLIDNAPDQWVQTSDQQLGRVVEQWLREPSDNWGLRIRLEYEFAGGLPEQTRAARFVSIESPSNRPATLTLYMCEPCPGDLDFNQQIDFFDISSFIVLYQSGSFEADLNGDGELNFYDVSTILQYYTGGCY